MWNKVFLAVTSHGQDKGSKAFGDWFNRVRGGGSQQKFYLGAFACGDKILPACPERPVSHTPILTLWPGSDLRMVQKALHAGNSPLFSQHVNHHFCYAFSQQHFCSLYCVRETMGTDRALEEGGPYALS